MRKLWGIALIAGVAAVSCGDQAGQIPTDWRTDPQFIQAGPLPIQVLGRGAPVLLNDFQDFTIDPAYLRSKLIELTRQERGSNSGKALARVYLKTEFEALGFVVSEHRYRSGVNFVAERAGEDPSKFLILSAHLDSVHNAGADDNGSGIVSSLAIAHALKDRKLTHSIRFVAFDQEEEGLVGSRAYVASEKNLPGWANLIGDLNIEMTGYNSRRDGAFHVIDCDREDSTFLSEAVAGAVTKLNIPLKRVRACTERSDHAIFWRAGKPAIVVAQNFFGGDANPCYHRSCDTVENVNFEYMAEVTRALASATAFLVGVQ